MRRTISGSQGKGSRRRPWRDGGRRKSSQRTSWRDYARSAVALESDLSPRTTELRFGIFVPHVATKLSGLDADLSRAGVRFFVRLVGRSGGGAFGTMRFRLLVNQSDV